MSTFETFFAFSFISTFSVALLATWLRYVPTLIALYRVIVYQWNQPGLSKYADDRVCLLTFPNGARD